MITLSVSNQPQAPYVRIRQIDSLRGFAVLGIYFVNIFIFALPYSMEGLEVSLNDSSEVNRAIYFISSTFVEGTMRALFSILFGASALIFLSEARLAAAGTDLVDHYYRRTLLLIVFGAIHAYVLLWPYDVLYAYGLLGLFLYPLRKMSAHALIVTGIILLFIGDIKLSELSVPGNFETSLSSLDVAEDNGADEQAEADRDAGSTQEKTAADSKDGEGRNNKTEQYANQLEVEKEVALYRSGYGRIFASQIEMVIIQHSAKIYLSYFYDIGGMMLIGMGLFRVGLLSGQFSYRIYLVLAVLGLALGTGTKGLIALSDVEQNRELLEPLAELGIGYNLSRLFMAVGYIGLVGLLCIASSLQLLQKLLSNVGRMALTSYIMQTIISVIIFYGPGFGMFAKLQRSELVLIVVAVWVFQGIFSSTWLAYYRQGPVEWLWRCLIYGSWLSNKKV